MEPEKQKQPFDMNEITKELIQPFKDLFHTSRALFGLNLSYMLEGLTYFGVVGLLAIYFNDYIKLDDIRAGNMVGVLTAGITLSMLFLGATIDWIGVRKALLYSLTFMLAGRVFLTLAPHMGQPGLWGSINRLLMPPLKSLRMKILPLWVTQCCMVL